MNTVSKIPINPLQHKYRYVVIVTTIYSPSWLGHETAKEPFSLQVNLPPANLSTTDGGGFTLSRKFLNVKLGSCEYQFFWSLVRPARESNQSLPFQYRTIHPLDHCYPLYAKLYCFMFSSTQGKDFLYTAPQTGLVTITLEVKP